MSGGKAGYRGRAAWGTSQMGVPFICITKRITRFAKIDLPVPGPRDGEITAKTECE